MKYTIERLKNCMNLTEGTYEEIDKDMIPILIELNEKGYNTRYCCQGHVERGSYITYLTFNMEYIFSEPIPVFSLTINKKNKHTKIGKSTWGGNTYYWFGSIKKTNKESEEERKELINELTEWAKKLKPREENLIKKYYLWGKTGNRTKCLGKEISEEERNEIKSINEYEKYEEIFMIVDGDKWENKYMVI